MRKLIVATTILAIAGVAPCLARGGHGHGHHQVHGHSRHALSAPANPSVPPSLTSDAGVTGSAPLPSHRQLKTTDTPAPEKLDPEDDKLDQRIKSICRGC
ncbi:MAG TPA: hypothetical protein VGM09_04290 [Bradyrhizobium sp.]|jgi:hypothetical protein